MYAPYGNKAYSSFSWNIELVKKDNNIYLYIQNRKAAFMICFPSIFSIDLPPPLVNIVLVLMFWVFYLILVGC